MSLKIDCHTHIVSEEIRDDYFSKVSNYALVMQFPDSIMANPQCFDVVKSDSRLFLCPCIDLKKPIKPQLLNIEGELDELRVVGLKIYLSYQSGAADDELLMPVYDFAAKHRLSVTFHTGLCSLVLPSDNDLEGSSAAHIAAAAEKYPEVNFIAAHMDDPNFESCMKYVCSHDNMFTDISGAYEPGTSFDADLDSAIDLFKAATDLYPRSFRHFLYGTDFCPPISLYKLEEYDYSAKRMFGEDKLDDIYYKNALRAFPRLRDYLKL